MSTPVDEKQLAPIRIFEVGVPVEEVWVFRVAARSPAEAERMVHNMNTDAEGHQPEQVCSFAGSKGFTREVK